MTAMESVAAGGECAGAAIHTTEMAQSEDEQVQSHVLSCLQ